MSRLTDLSARLQQALGPIYRLEKELGGGGMSRVFLAEEVALGRRVVIKVLPPEMAAGVNQDRFRREIQLAARLQHPHIVPLLTAGSQDDLLWYAMPYIEGESLRTRLAREGELPVAGTLRILRDVLDALAYAHAHGVVHRDIKPDNVLLTGKHAVVTDFGVAKAVSEATGGQSLTSLGVALGTPAYMAPEQAAGNPHVDHRADLYAVGAMAYEMVTGRPPFSRPTAQAVLAAHVTEPPEPPATYRSAIPEALNALILRCLEKLPADRWQRAEELGPHVEAMLTPTGGTTPVGTAPAITPTTEAALRRAHPVRVAALFGAASAAVLAVVYAIMFALGLPDWVFAGAVVLLAIGLPIMLLTGQQERRRAVARTMGLAAATPSGLRRHLTWRTSLLGGLFAFAGLGVVAAGYMAMRALGIGPVGTLMATGALEARDPLVLATFENRTADSTLGPTVTELLRVGLAQSRVVNVLDPTELARVLERMERDPLAPVDRHVALEIAEREGFKAVITGEVVAIGTGYALTARVLSTAGRMLTAQQESAANADGMIAAVDRLATKLRERIGESLRTIRANEALDRVTTSSLEALRRYTQAVRADNAGDPGRAVQLLEEAVRIDTAFAMAYRKLGVLLGNAFEQRARTVEALTKAYEHRDRLTERERYQAAGIYHIRVTGDQAQAIQAYESLLDMHPDDDMALNNLGVLYGQLRDFRKALAYYRRTLEADSGSSLAWTNLAYTHVQLGELDAADSVLERFVERFPDNSRIYPARYDLLLARRDYAGAEELTRRGLADVRGDPLVRSLGSKAMAYLLTMQGRLAEGRRYWEDVLAIAVQRGLPAEYVASAAEAALPVALLAGRPDDAVAQAEAALRRYPLERMNALDRPYDLLVLLHGFAGRAADARRYTEAFVESVPLQFDLGAQRRHHEMLGVVALAEGRYREAIAEFRLADEGNPCRFCEVTLLSRAYDLADDTDSAIAMWEHYAAAPGRPEFIDATDLPLAYRRLGELYEQRGDREKAVQFYGQFVDLWKNADPELQPQVDEVRRRLARLLGDERRRGVNNEE